MPKRVPLQSIVVQRDVNGTRTNFTPPIGEAFEFSADEIKFLEKHNPQAIGKQATVDVVDEKPVAPLAKTVDEAGAIVKAANTGAKKPAGGKGKDEDI